MTDACGFDASQNINHSFAGGPIVCQTSGAAVLSALYKLGDQGQLDGSSGNSILTNIVSYGFSIAITQCSQSFLAEQKIQLDCNNAVQNDRVLNNINCLKCVQIIQNEIASRNQLEADAHALNNAYTPQVADPALLAQILGQRSDYKDGICKYVCLQCVAEGLSQNIQMNLSTVCDVTSQTFITAWTSGMNLQTETEITLHQNALKDAGIKIESESDIQNLAFQVSDTISTMTSQSTLNQLYSQALALQNTSITSNSTSIVANNISQSITIDMFATLVSKTYSDTEVRNAVNNQITEELITIETSFTDLIKDLQGTVSTLNDLLSTLIGRIMITVVVLLCIGLLIFSAFIFFNTSSLSSVLNQDLDAGVK